MISTDILFVATTIHLGHITTALNCLTPFGVKDDILIIIDEDGLSFAQENNHVIKIQLFLSKDIFQTYNYQPSPTNSPDSYTKVSVKINHILNSMSIINRDRDDIVECTISYNGEGSPFILIFEDALISEKVEYSTYMLRNIDNTGLEIDRERLDFECIIKGDILYSVLKDLKEVGCKDCYIYAVTKSHVRPTFAIISKSQFGYSKILLPSERSILEKLEIYNGDSTTLVDDVPVIGLFDFVTFDKIRLCVKIASKLLIRRDIHGLMTVNILSQTEDVILKESKLNQKKHTYTGNNQSKGLPSDCPGIVIEVSMLEKIMSEDLDGKEIQLMMDNTSNLTVSRPIKKLLNATKNVIPVNDEHQDPRTHRPAADARPLFF